jgi:hypothetical protein
METPRLDQLTDRSQKENILTLLKSRTLVEILRSESRNRDLDNKIKRFGFKASLDWVENGTQWILFTGPDDVLIINAFSKYDEVYTWIPVEHIANFVEAERLLDLLLKEF